MTVPTNLLASRLKGMEANGLVRRRPLPAPAGSVVVYELTESGEDLGTAVVELARWGMVTLPPTRAERPFRAHWLVLALRARFDPGAAAGVTESYEFRVEGHDPVHFELADGRGTAGTGPARDPAVVIAADADTFVALTGGATTPREAIRRGARIEGEPEAIARMSEILPPRRSDARAVATGAAA